MLRAAEPEDLDLMYLVENDTALWEFGNTNVPYSRFALRQFIEQTSNDINTDGQVRLVIALSSNRNAIGFVDLQNYDLRHRRAEVGIVIMPEWQRQGLGNEVLQLLEEYAYNHLYPVAILQLRLYSLRLGIIKLPLFSIGFATEKSGRMLWCIKKFFSLRL